MTEQAKPMTEQERSRAMAESHAEAADKALDTTVPGGRYVVDGVLVDCNGKPLKKD